MRYEIEEAALFWETLEALYALAPPDRIDYAVAMLLTWVVEDPKRALPSDKGIRILKLPSIDAEGVRTEPLRLAYYLDETPRRDGADGTVMLLHVVRYDEEQELLDDADTLDNGKLPPHSH